jgi:hypothetical protein
LAAQVIHAWVEKQRKVRNDNNYAAVDKDGHPIELSGLWSEGKAEDGASDRMMAGNLDIPAQLPAPKPVDPATLLVAPPPAVSKVH